MTVSWSPVRTRSDSPLAQDRDPAGTASPAGGRGDPAAGPHRRAVAGPARALRTADDGPRAAARRNCRGHRGPILAEVIVQDDAVGAVERAVSIDATSVRAHQHVAEPGRVRCRAGRVDQLAVDGEALGRSHCGLTSELHLAVDGRGLPEAIRLAARQAGDHAQLLPLLDPVEVARVGPGLSR